MLPTPATTVPGTLGVRVRSKTSSLLYREPLFLFIDVVGVEFVFYWLQRVSGYALPCVCQLFL